MDELQQLAATCPVIPYAQGIFSTSIALDENTIIYKLWEMPNKEQTLKEQQATPEYIMSRFGDSLADSGYLADEHNLTDQVANSLAYTLNMRVIQQANVVQNQIEATKELLSFLCNKDMISAYISLIALKNANNVIESSWMYGWEEWISKTAEYILENATKNELEQMEDLL